MYIKKPKKEFNCLMCGKTSIMTRTSNQKYCGSEKKKIGCSYQQELIRKRQIRKNGIAYRTRFEVLLRDKFTCQYCGRKSPDVILHVDHKLAKSRGGIYHKDNLITACLECNVGKGDLII